jgi:hypothetical protein
LGIATSPSLDAANVHAGAVPTQKAHMEQGEGVSMPNAPPACSAFEASFTRQKLPHTPNW